MIDNFIFFNLQSEFYV